MKTIARTEQEIEKVLEKAMQARNEGTNYRSMTYEDGILCFAEWLFGETEDNPFD